METNIAGGGGGGFCKYCLRCDDQVLELFYVYNIFYMGAYVFTSTLQVCIYIICLHIHMYVCVCVCVNVYAMCMYVYDICCVYVTIV